MAGISDNGRFRLSGQPPLCAAVAVTAVTTLSLILNGLTAVHGQPEPLVSDKYYGTPLGPLLPGGPASGQVYAADQSTLFIRGFTFDGSRHPFTYFQAGSTLVPDGTGFQVPDEKGTFNQLGDYKDKDLVLKLPAGRSLRDVRWFAVWSRNNHLAMGQVPIPVGVELPRPLDLGPLNGLAHGVRSGPITVMDAQTILVPHFWYDGQGPAAYWWATKGPRQSPDGLRLKDETGSVRPLRAYHGETVMLSLPDTTTIYDFDWLGVWCEQFQTDFGHVRIPHHQRVPPSPPMLGLKPEARLNCEVLDDTRGFEVRWIMDGDDIVLQLVARTLPNEYMSLGWSRDDTRSLMVDADAVVAWVDALGAGHAQDYHLNAREPCVGSRGACPDLRFAGATDGVTLLHAAVVNGFRMVTLKRPQLAVDEQYDQHIYSDGQQAIIWAIGPLNSRQEVAYHTQHQFGNRYINFARPPQWNCPSPDPGLTTKRRWQRLVSTATNQTVVREVRSDSPAAKRSPSWKIPRIVCPKDRALWAQLGPRPGSGPELVWYINGLLTPELVLERGVTYTFWVEGGNDPERSHPLYITSSVDGGFQQKTADQRRQERVFAGLGITSNGTILPTAEGRRCQWRTTQPATRIEDYGTFEQFRATLVLECQPNGQPGMLRFTTDANTPQQLYYQCYNHRNMGGKVRIVDSCPKAEALHTADTIMSASVVKPIQSTTTATNPYSPWLRPPAQPPVSSMTMTKKFGVRASASPPLSGGFVPIAKPSVTKNNRIWPSSRRAQNKFNHDILRVSSRPSSPPPPVITSTMATNIAFELPNGVLSDDEPEPINADGGLRNRNQTDHTILSDVMRLIAHHQKVWARRP